MTFPLLMIVKWANTGLLLWDSVGPLVENALSKGEMTVSLEDVGAAAAQAGVDIDSLQAAIDRKKNT